MNETKITKFESDTQNPPRAYAFFWEGRQELWMTMDGLIYVRSESGVDRQVTTKEMCDALHDMVGRLRSGEYLKVACDETVVPNRTEVKCDRPKYLYRDGKLIPGYGEASNRTGEQ